LLPRLHEGESRDHQEMDLQLALSWSVAIGIGLRAPERESALARAGELGEQLGDNAKLIEALLALAHFHFNSRDYGPAQELAERVLAIAEPAETPATAAGAHVVLGLIQSSRGDLVAGRQHLERAIELFAAGPYRDPGANIFARKAPNTLATLMCVLGF